MIWGVLGGKGQLGQSLTMLLREKGVRHYVWGKRDIDVCNLESVKKILNYEPNFLVNCAAWTDVELAEKRFEDALIVNREGVRNVAFVARDLGIPLLHFSTDYVFSGYSRFPRKVDDPKDPRSNYGISKLEGEYVLQQVWRENSYILRTAWLFSPFGKNFVKTIIRKLITSREKIRVVDDQFGQPTSALDLAARVFEIQQLEVPPGTYHATNSGSASWWEFATEIALLMGESPKRIVPISSLEYSSGVVRPQNSVLDLSCWQSVNLPNMRHWRCALTDNFPMIRSEVEREMRSE